MKQLITKINGVDIFAESTDNGIFVPVKPICEAIGIASNKQIEKIKEDEILSSVATLRVSTGADEKSYEMFCLPLEFVYGWLFTINPKNVNETAKGLVTKYKYECYHALYEHFYGSMHRTIETNEAEIAMLKSINDMLEEEKRLKAQRKETEKSLEKLRSERLNPQPSLF